MNESWKKPKDRPQVASCHQCVYQETWLPRFDELPLLNNYDAFQRLMAQRSI